MGTSRTAEADKRLRQAFLARLDLAMTSLGLSRADVGRAIGASGGTVYEWFSKGALPKGTKILRLGDAFPQISIHWLMTGRGAMLAPEVRGHDAVMGQGAGVVLARLGRWMDEERARWAAPGATPASAAPEIVQAAELVREAPTRKRPPRSQAS